MTAALEQLHQAVRQVAGASALTRPLIEQRLDAEAMREAAAWRWWRASPIAQRDVAPARLVRMLERSQASA